MKKIKLTQGKVALVDNEDFEYLNQFKWYALNPFKDLWYAVRSAPREEGKTRGVIRMHKVIINTNKLVDHIDGDGLNNQRGNLREATVTQNNVNRKKRSKGVETIKKLYKGKQYIYYRARCRKEGKDYLSKQYPTHEEAAVAYVELSKSLYGEFARI